MPETFRNRDCVVLYKGDAYPVEVSDAMAASGWPGGVGVQWSAPGTDRFVVDISDGYYAGFMLWGSDESGDRYTSLTKNQTTYKIGTLCAGGWLVMTTSFERYTYASRQAGPLVEIVYAESDRLVFSLRGYWTSEDEWTLSGDPRGANTYYIAFVVQVPTEDNNYFMTVQTSI